MMSSNLRRSMNIRRYAASPDISKKNSVLQNQEIILNKEGHLFMNIFCSSPGGNNDYNQAPIFLNLSNLQNVIKKIEFNKDGNIDYDGLNNYQTYHASPEDRAMIDKIKHIYKHYMPVFRVRENPNKFLSEALKQRKEKSVYVQDKSGSSRTHDLSDPSDTFYMGLERVAQFLNFCVMLQQMPTKDGEQIQNTNQTQLLETPQLEFEPKVLAELLRQFKEESDELNKIFTVNERATYEDKLKNLHKQYDYYYVGKVNSGNPDFMSFAKWIQQDKIEFQCGKGLAARQSDKLVETYFTGGGIKNENELTKLLKLDAVLQAGKAIEEFIDTKAVDASTLGWFQKLWNSIVQGTWIANKLGWFFKEKKSIKLKSNRFIPRLDEHENKETDLNKTTEKDLNDIN